ncbi:MAG: Chaperone protein HtpG [Pelotomaculum sp. PtaB.Bin104]|nr:MAG: Chaperone protein HtpG [Pelotomaculum sp. PtaB.Bin104]
MTEAAGEKAFETREFQAEVKQVLDIVVNSLYTDREIFLRELISNAADALEKLRYESLTNQTVEDKELPLEITIEADDKEHTVTITDSGIGMTKDELIENLGTIAHSGSKTLVQQLADADRKDLSLIGQFGVGFYAAFMVAKKIRVLSKSYQAGAAGWEWASDGIGSYTIGPAEGLTRGTKIILELKDDAYEFAGTETIKRIIRQYSSFVSFPITVNGEKVNTIQAIWTRNKNEITEEEYNEFYKFIANAYDEPLFRLHFSADAPLAINALLFVPKHNFERFGFGRMEPGVNLYCRKVLIQQQAENILPEWLRFVKGVVDSEDIPLNISRETMQDSALVARLRRAITGRFLRFLNEQAKNSPDKYAEFWQTFGIFIKEGLTTDFTHRDDLAKLLRFESSATEGKLTSLAEYIERMPEGQKEIYYINGPTREIIEAGPYLEAFRARNLEVIYTHEPVDDFVLSNLMEYQEKKLVSADQAELELAALEDSSGAEPLDSEMVQALAGWLKDTLGDRVSEVKESKRLVESPAVILNQDSMMTSSMQRVMQAVNKDLGAMGMGKKVLEINTRHALIKRLAALREKDADFAKTAAEQIYDNALISAGLMADPRGIVERMYQILERALD